MVLEKVKKIYLNADGGTWIQSGKKRIAGITSVLDEFHLQKYLLKMTGHMKDSKGMQRRRTCKLRFVRAYEFPPNGMEPGRGR